MRLLPVNRYRRVALLLLVGIAIILAVIVAQTVLGQKSLHARIENYKTMQTYPNVHVHGNELDLIYLAPEKDSLTECEVMCLENEQCVAVNYYPANLQQKHSAQCWRFKKIEGQEVELDQPCCTLSIRNSEMDQVKILDERTRLKNSKTMHVYPNVHVQGNELKLIYLAHEKESLTDCEAFCLDNGQCVAVNYYPPSPDKKKSAQCWLFKGVDGKAAELAQPCCSLAIRDDEKDPIGILDERLKQSLPSSGVPSQP